MKKGDLVKYKDEKEPYIIVNVGTSRYFAGVNYKSLFVIESKKGKIKAVREDELQQITNVL